MWPALIFLGTVLCGYILRKFVFVKLSQWAKKSSTQIDDVILSAIKGPFILWFLILGLYFAMQSSKLPEGFAQTTNKILIALAIFSITLVLAKITGALIALYSSKFGTAMPVSSLTHNISRIVIFGVGILIILNSLGISITPILATLGVGGLAVALALQDTLSNLFSGFHMSMARQINIGDYIKLDTGEEGYVVDIDWRATKIRMLPNNVVLIPNAKLSQAIVTNYCLPEKEMAVLVQVGVHYDSDLKKVEKVTCEVAKETMQQVNGGVARFAPFIRYHTFGDSSINFTVILRAKEFVDQYLVKHEFVKRLHERYAKEGITIPYPIRAINYAQEKAA
jgi:small-conductance mechanosensitive channel